MTPEVKSIPQYTWALISENISVTTINNLSIHFNFYYTTRSTGDAAPAALTGHTLPQEAVNMFPDTSTEFILPTQTGIDLYVLCFSRNDIVTAPGSLLVNDGVGNSLPVNPGGGLDVNLQDQTTPAVLVKFNQVQNSTVLTAEGTAGTDTITVSDPTGFIVGSYIILFSDEINRYYVGYATGVAGSVVTLDTLLDVTYPIGADVSAAITNMAVNGAVTRQTFGVRSADLSGSIDIKVDITRIIFSCLTATAVDLAKFADIAELTRGLMLRKKNGVTSNIFNVKTNHEIDGITLDWKPYDKSKPNEGQDGFTARLTFGGQDKVGVVQRLAPGEDLEFIIQDDLTDITLLEVMAEGHVVD